MVERYSAEFVEHLTNGPFPGTIDVWAEAGRYFQQIHSGMIDHILEQIQRPLLAMGYLAGKETSLQIMEGRQPDVFVRRSGDQGGRTPTLERWDYVAAAVAVMSEPGLEAEEPELLSLHITEFATSQLVTVVEIVSPRNKSQDYVIEDYRQRRARLVQEQGINVVEIDPTRSVKRLLDHPFTASAHYHVAVYLPLEWPRVIPLTIGEPIKRFALPLRGQVVPVEPQAAYDHAYRTATIAGHIQNEGRYTEDALPFPTLLSDDQRRQALVTVQKWQERLARLSHS
jgi:hypothetical protein